MNTPANYLDYLSTPMGTLEIIACAHHLHSIKFISKCLHTVNPNKITQQCQHQLNEYFAGQRQVFALPLQPAGTDFQCEVWQQLRAIPFASTCTYGDIAKAINRPKAVRAVGAANGKNPFTIVVPCHRVIGANGSLTGYAWGTAIKSALLQHEQHVRYQH